MFNKGCIFSEKNFNIHIFVTVFRHTLQAHCRIVSSFTPQSPNCLLFRTRLQDKKCTYNVILRRVHATTIAVEGNKYGIVWVCFCVQSTMYMRHIVICGLPWFTIFFHIIS
jgi:hypothetical protein